MRKGLMMVVVLLAVASLMAAMAYNSATITSAQELKVVNTKQALLGISPGTGVGNKDGTAYIDGDGILKVEFGKSGIDKNGFPGLQPGSVYTWDKLISIRNKSAEDLDVTIKVTGELAQYLTIKGAPGGWYRDLVPFDKGTSTTFGLTSDYTIPLTFTVDIPRGADLNTFDGEIIVEAVAR